MLIRCPVRLLSAALALLALPALVAAQPAKNDPKNPQPKLDRDGSPLPAHALARLGELRFQHPAPVATLGFGDAGKSLVTVTTEGELRFWDLAGKKELRRLTLPKGAKDPFLDRYMAVLPVAFSRDGKIFAWQDANGGVTVFNATTGDEIARLKKEAVDQHIKNRVAGSLALRLSADGKVVLVTAANRSQRRQAILWRTDKDAPHCVLNADDNSQWLALDLSPDGTFVAVCEISNAGGLQNGHLRLWNVADGKERSLEIPARYPNLVRILPGNKILAIHDRFGNGLDLVDAVTGKALRRVAAPNDLGTLVPSADGKRLLGVGGGQGFVWDADNGQELARFPAGTPTSPVAYSLAEGLPAAVLSPDDKTVAAAANHTVRLWDAATGKELGDRVGHGDTVAALAFAPDGQQVVSAAAQGQLLLWETAAGKRLHAFDLTAPKGAAPLAVRLNPYQTQVNPIQIAVGPEGKTVAALPRNGAFHLWDAATAKPLTWANPPQNLAAFAFAPDRKHLALAARDGLRLTHAATGKEARVFPVAPAKLTDDEQFVGLAGHVLFSANGKMLFAASEYQHKRLGGSAGNLVHVFEVATGLPRQEFALKIQLPGGPNLTGLEANLAAREQVVSMAASADGKYLATATAMAVKVWDPLLGEEVRAFLCPGLMPLTCAFSPDGLLLAGRADGKVRVWDVATGTVLADYPAHQLAVAALAFSPDGKYLATGCADTTALVWDWPALRKDMLAAKAHGKLETLWQELALLDGPKSSRALVALAQTPKETVAYLKGQLQPVPRPDAERMKKLFLDLDSKQFQVRDKATAELEKLGDLVRPLLTKQLKAADLPLEVQRRLEALQEKLDGAVSSPALLQGLRALEVLERIGTPEARTLLEALAAGALGHRLTEEAALVAKRLKQ